MPPHVVDLVYSKIDNPIPYDQQVSFNLVTMYKQMVLATTKELFMGMPLRVGDKPQPGAGSLELAPHNTVHVWTGDVETPNREDMGVFYSAARDPIFYPHHSNIDRMWEVWKNLGEGKREYNDDLDWLDSQFFFYDENANLVRVKVRDCIDTKKLGYVYEDVDLPWMNSPPKSTRNKLLREAKKGEGIEFGSDKFVKFDVHINDDEDNLSGPDQAEFVGSFVSLSHGGKGKVNTCFKVGISKVLENLEAEEDEDMVVTLAPKVGKGEVIIGSIKIGFIPKY
ncbi:putative domain, di-copper centre [Sesbania bispinosa]|nr:putative domain, di-copper centre [Sesbania bispinosa]